MVAESSALHFAGLASAAARLVVGGALTVAGIAKTIDMERFADTLMSFPLTNLVFASRSQARRGAFALAALEVSSGLVFVLGYEIRPVAILILGLLGSFSLGVILVLLRRQDIACGCFGHASSRSVGWTTFGRNVALALLTLLATVSPSISLDGVLNRTTSFSVYAALLVAGVQIGALASLAGALLKLRSLPGYFTEVPPIAMSTVNES